MFEEYNKIFSPEEKNIIIQMGGEISRKFLEIKKMEIFKDLKKVEMSDQERLYLVAKSNAIDELCRFINLFKEKQEEADRIKFKKQEAKEVAVTYGITV